MKLSPYKVTEVQPLLKLLLYGIGGVGKTSLAASAQNHPLLRDVLVANHEGGLLSVKHIDGVQAIDIKTMDELEELYWAMVRRSDEFKTINTLVIDSGTELQALDLEHIVQEEVKKAEGGKKTKRTSIDDIWQEDYRVNTSRLRRLFRWYRDAPFNVIITALKKTVTRKPPGNPDAEAIVVDMMPAFTTKLGEAVFGFMDHVWYMFVGESGEHTGKHLLATQNVGVTRAKTRGFDFSNAIGNPVDVTVGSEGALTLSQIYDLLLQNTGEQQ